MHKAISAFVRPHRPKLGNIYACEYGLPFVASNSVKPGYQIHSTVNAVGFYLFIFNWANPGDKSSHTVCYEDLIKAVKAHFG